MKDFGLFTSFSEKVDVDGISTSVLIFRNKDGVDWFDIARSDPHPYYIAIDDDGRIYSMEEDFQCSQIAGRLIGIDSDYGYTRGPGGTVYGKIWNGSAIVEPGPETQPIPDEISRRQFFQHLAAMGIISKAEALAAMQGGVIPAPLQVIIDQLPTEDDRFEAQMFVVGAQNFNRLHWLTDKVRQAMAWTFEQRDEFWRDAAKL